MSTTCARKGCRKKATYVVFLTKSPLQENAKFLQRWPLCNEDRDRVESVIAEAMEARIAVLAGMARVKFPHADLAAAEAALTAPPASAEPESTPVTPEAPVAPAPGGRPVARPSS